MKKYLVTALALVLALAVVAGRAGAGEGKQADGSPARTGLRMAVILPSLGHEFWNNYLSFLQTGAKEMNIELTVLNSEDSADKCAKYIEDACAMGVDALIFTPYFDLGKKCLADTKLANNLQYAIENPMTFITAPATPYDWYPHNEDATRSDQNDKLWGDDGDASDGYGKSIYDPCPAGWRVPINGAWHGLVNTTDTDYAFPWVAAQYGRFGDVASGGWNVTGWTWADPAQTPGGKATLGYYPADGYRSYDTGALNYVGMSGHRWLSAMYVPSPSDASYFYIGAGNLYPSYVAGRSYAFPVRCVTE